MDRGARVARTFVFLGAVALFGGLAVSLGSCHSGPVSSQGINAPCTRDKDCERGLDCQSGVCLLRCEERDDCPEGYQCRRDFCVDDGDGGADARFLATDADSVVD